MSSLFVVPGVPEKFDQNLDFNFLQYVQKVTFKLFSFVLTNIIKSLANFLKMNVTVLNRVDRYDGNFLTVRIFVF